VHASKRAEIAPSCLLRHVRQTKAQARGSPSLCRVTPRVIQATIAHLRAKQVVPLRARAMVWFQCEMCGDSLKKPKLGGHMNHCRGTHFTCIDCSQTFDRQSVQARASERAACARACARA